MRVWIVLIALASLVSSPQVNRSRRFGPGVCGPIDPVYIKGATETGGQPFPMGPSEIASAAHIMTESSRSDTAMLLWAGGTATDSPREYSIPVDSSVRRVTFSATFDGSGGSVMVADPEGRVIQQGPGAQDTIFSCGRILSVDGPAVGAWRVVLRPTTRFWLVVHGRSDLDVLSAQFVAVGGRPGHEGLFRISGQPIAGRPATLRVNLSDHDMKTPRFVLMSTEGQRLQDVELPAAGDDEYVGTVDLPSVPFRVAATWVDSAGVSYQRLHKSLFHAELVEVLPSGVESVTAGESVTLAFVVRNFGPRTRYRMQATYGANVVDRVEPDVVEIEEGGEQRINVLLQVPAGAAGESDSTVIVVATSEGSVRATTNSVVQRLRVVKN